jgi:hypothetical protein
MQQQDPEQAQQAQANMTQLQSQMQKLQESPNIEQVLKFLKDQKARAFTLDIETDSTVMQDEMMEKQQRTEFMGVLAQLLPQLSAMITSEPKTTEFCGDVLKFATAPFRAGRSLEGSIDELVELMKAKGDQPRGDDAETAKTKANTQNEQAKLQYQREKDEADRRVKALEIAQKGEMHEAEQETLKQLKLIEMQTKTRDDELRAQTVNQKQMADREKHQGDMIKKRVEVQAAQEKARLASEQMEMRRSDMAAKQQERAAMQTFKQQDAIARRGIIPP